MCPRRVEGWSWSEKVPLVHNGIAIDDSYQEIPRLSRLIPSLYARVVLVLSHMCNFKTVAEEGKGTDEVEKTRSPRSQQLATLEGAGNASPRLSVACLPFPW